MALQYFKYDTDYGNTIVDRSDTSFSPIPPYEEIHIDFSIPETQPLYFYANSGGTGGTIIVNSQTNIDNYLNSIAPSPTSDSNIDYGTFTGVTTNLQSQIDLLSGGSVNIDTIITVAPSGATFTSIQAAIDSVTDATTDKRYLIDVYSGTYVEDINMKNYVFLKGNSASNVKIFGNLTIAPIGFGFTKVSDVEFTTTERTTATINTIGLAQLNNVVLSSTWTGNTLQKSTINVQRGVVQLLSDGTVMRLTDTYTGATQTSDYIIRVSGSNEVILNANNSTFLMEVDSNITELGLIKHTNTADSDVVLDNYNFTLNLHGSAPTNLIKLKNLEGGNGDIQASDATTYVDSDNAATPTIISAYVSGATAGSHIDYTTSKIDWKSTIPDENIYIGAATTINDGIRALNVIFETQDDTVPEIYTADGNLGNEYYLIYNGVGTSYNSESTITNTLIIGNVDNDIITDYDVSLTGNSTSTIISEYGIREFASDDNNIIHTNSGWTATTQTVNGFLNEFTVNAELISGTGYAESLLITKTGTFEITVLAGNGGVIAFEGFYKKINWSQEVFDVTGYAPGPWNVYVTTGGTITLTQSNLDNFTNINLGFFFMNAGDVGIGTINSSKRRIDSFGTRAHDFAANLGGFIYDGSGKAEPLGISGTSAMKILLPEVSVQQTFDNVTLQEISSDDAGTNFFFWYQTPSGFSRNFYAENEYDGRISTHSYNDPTKSNIIPVVGGTITFTSGSSSATTSVDLTSQIIVGDHIYLTADTDFYMQRVYDINATTISFGTHTYKGAGGTGAAIVNKALVDIPNGKYAKHQIIRDYNNNTGYANFVNGTVLFDTREEAIAGSLPPIIGLESTNLKIVAILTTSGQTSLDGQLIDIRPLSFPYQVGGSGGSGSGVNVHANLLGLGSDDHLQYLKTDGTRDITGIQSYDNIYNFTGDTNIVTKRFVDDKKYSTDVITGGTFNTAQIPNLDTSKITTGTFDVARIPDLNASIISGGTLLTTVIPNLNASIITGGTFIDIVTPSVRPPSDSVTALQIKNATGGTIVNFDTISGLTGFGESSPQGLIHAYGRDNNDSDLINTQTNAIIIDGVAGADKDIAWFEDGEPRWVAETYRNEDGVYWYLYNNKGDLSPLTISESGRVGINSVSNIIDYLPVKLTGPYSGTSTNEVIFSGLYDKNYIGVYQVSIDDNITIPNTFIWRKSVDGGEIYGDWSTSTGCTTGATIIDSGVEVSFIDVSGFTSGDTWQITAFPQLSPATLSVIANRINKVYYTPNYPAPTPTYLDLSTTVNTTIVEKGLAFQTTTDAVYVGGNTQITDIFVNVLSGGVGFTSVIEYWNGSSWVDITVGSDYFVDETDNLSKTGTYKWNTSTMTDWVKSDLNSSGDEYYWLRVRTSSVPSVAPILGGISRGNDKRFGIYSSALDINPSFYVDALGRTSVGGGNITSKNLFQVGVTRDTQESQFDSMVEFSTEDSTSAALRLRLSYEGEKGYCIGFAKNRGTATDPEPVQSGDEIGTILWGAAIDDIETGVLLGDITTYYTGDNVSKYGDMVFKTHDNSSSPYPTEVVRISGSGNTGFGNITVPTAKIHIQSGSTTVAPLKFITGDLLTTPQVGAFEYDGTSWYGTITGDTRKTFAFLESPVFTGNPELPTGTTINNENLIDYILQSGGSSGGGFVTTNNFNTYTGDTDSKITYVSGVTDTKLPTATFNSYTGGTIAWDKVNKTGSDLADLATRNAEDVNISLAHWSNVNNVDDYVQKSAQYLEDTQGSGRLSPETVLGGRLTQSLIVSGGTGYIIYSDFFSEISWSGETIDVSGYAEGTYYVYVDTNGDIQVSTSNPDGIHNIRLGFFYYGGTLIGVIQQCGCVVLNSLSRTVNYMLRQGTFIYDNGGNVQIGTGSTLSIVSSPCKIQFGLLDIQLSEIGSTDASTFKFANFFNTSDADWETNYYFGLFRGGIIPTGRWNDITKPALSAITGSVTFTQGSNVVTSTTDLTSLISEDNYIYLSADTSTYSTPVTGATWTGSQTNIYLRTPYYGAGGTGTMIANYSLPKLPAGKYGKHLIVRASDDTMYFIFAQTYYDSEDAAIAGVTPALPASIADVGIKMATIVTTSGMTDLTGNIYDIRPLPYQDREGGQSGGGTAISVHGDLSGLGADDHLQYLRTDGARALTGIQSYQSQPTFTNDLHIVSKKYVDDADNLKLNISVFNTYTGTTIPNTYYNKTEIDVYTGATATLFANKQDTITGAATTITDTDLTTNRALISVVGKVGVSTVTSTELSYVGGVTSGIQGQLNLKAPIANPALTGIPTAPTAAAGVNTTQIATTAYYISNASNVSPLMDGTVAVGTSTRFARQDHRHPSNTAKANLAGGATFTGIINVPKPSINDNSTCVATTSWYVGQAATTTPLTNGSAAIGTSLLFARQDHRHATDTSRLAVTDFNTFSGTTLPANYYNKTEVYNKTEINSYTGTTDTLIGTKLDTTIFNTYTGNTIGVTASRKFSAGKLNDQVLSGSQGAVTNWNTEESFSNSEFYSWDETLGELTILQDGVYHINFDISILGTVGTSRSEGRSVIQEDVGAGFVDISYTEREYYVRQLNYGASTNANYLREYSAGDKIRATAWEPVGTTTLTLQGDGTLLTVVKSEVGINTLQYTGTTDQFVEKTDFVTYTGATQTEIDTKEDIITGGATTITDTDLTTDRVLVSNGTGKVAVSTVTTTELAALATNVYGTEYQLASSLASSTSTATTPQTKVSMTTTNLPAGTYKVLAAWRASHTSSTNSSYFDVTIGGTTQGTRGTISKEWQDVTNIESLSTVFYVTLSGTNTILLRYWNEGSSTTISDATIELIRVD